MSKHKGSIVSPAPNPGSGTSAPKGSTVNGVDGMQKRTGGKFDEVTVVKNPEGFKK